MAELIVALSDWLKFDEVDCRAANAEWGCNCGPSALACALGITLPEVRPLIPKFEERHYTSPTMMQEGLRAACVPYTPISEKPNRGLIRVQWTGPWTEPGANPKWAYRHTHWIAGFRRHDGYYVFDCNGGMRSFEEWQQRIVPCLTGAIKRADGGWYATHNWELNGKAEGSRNLRCWAIYAQPLDYPEEIIGRVHRIDSRGRQFVESEPFARGLTLDEVRRAVPAGCIRFPRQDRDVLSLVESWIQ